jgi:hypothetical protein
LRPFNLARSGVPPCGKTLRDTRKIAVLPQCHAMRESCCAMNDPDRLLRGCVRCAVVSSTRAHRGFFDLRRLRRLASPRATSAPDTSFIFVFEEKGAFDMNRILELQAILPSIDVAGQQASGSGASNSCTGGNCNSSTSNGCQGGGGGGTIVPTVAFF